MRKTKSRALVPFQAPAKENALVRSVKSLMSGIMGGSGRPRAAVDWNDPVWQAVLLNGGIGNQPMIESEAGVTVTPDLAMTISTVFGCVRLISESLAMLPLRLYERDGRSEVIAEGHPVDNILFRRPNKRQTAYQWKRLMATSMALRGNGYSAVVRGYRGEVIAVRPLLPQRMNMRQISDLEAVYQYTHYEGRYEELYQDEILHLQHITQDGLRGISPVAAARNSMGLVIQQERHASRLFTQGAQPMGVLKTQRTLSADAIALIRQQFEATYAGTDNAHRTLVLEEGMDWAKIGLNAEETQFLQSRKFSRTDLAMFFGIPPHMIGDVEKATSWGSGIEQQGIGFLNYTLMPWLKNFEETIDRDLLTEDERFRYFARFDVSSLMRGDLASRSTALIALKNNGIMTANEVRTELQINPSDEEGADALTVSTNTVYLDSPQVREGINRTAQAIAKEMPAK